MNERTTDLTAGPGGVMTDEVGVITGELTLRTLLDPDGPAVVVQVQYRDAAEWYVVTGSRVELAPGSDVDRVLDRVHADAVARATGPGR